MTESVENRERSEQLVELAFRYKESGSKESISRKLESLGSSFEDKDFKRYCKGVALFELFNEEIVLAANSETPPISDAAGELAIAAGVTIGAVGVQSARGSSAGEIIFIKPGDEASLNSLKQGQAAFPDLDYAPQLPSMERKKRNIRRGLSDFPDRYYNQPLPLLEDSPQLQKSIKSMQTILHNAGCVEPVEEMMGSADSVAKQMVWLENNINALVLKYRDKPDSNLAENIFHRIQLWGGITGRAIYVNGGGFHGNFSIQTYEAMIHCLLKGIETLTVSELAQSLIGKEYRIPQLGVSFATKHFRFWSNNLLPIYDNLMAEGVLGRPANGNHYPEFVRCLQAAARQKNVTDAILERHMFNFFRSDKGEQWKEFRSSSGRGKSQKKTIDEAIRSKVGKSKGKLTKRDLNSIIESFSSLKNKRVSDIQPLSELTGLYLLDLSGNLISDISPLDGLKKLKTLRLSNNKISDLTPLAKLKNLEELELHGNPGIESLEPLYGLKKLQLLTLPKREAAEIKQLQKKLPHCDIRVGKRSSTRTQLPSSRATKAKETANKDSAAGEEVA